MALAYVVCNLGLNISALALLRKAGAQTINYMVRMSCTQHNYTVLLEWMLGELSRPLHNSLSTGTWSTGVWKRHGLQIGIRRGSVLGL